MASKLKIKQVRSQIKCLENHKRTLRALGIRRMQQEVIQPDDPAIRGMVRRISYLVKVEKIDA